MSTRVQLPSVPLAARADAQRRWLVYAGGVLLLAASYYTAAKVGQTLRYTASVAAMWPPAGVGIAALYLWGLRWWPGILLGDLAVNIEQYFSDGSIPLGSLVGQQIGNMAEIVVGALLLIRLAGPHAGLDRVGQVIGMFAALAAAAAISATAGTISMLAGGVVAAADTPTFWRTWWLGDLAGALVVVSVVLAWSHSPAAAWRRLRTVEGALMLTAVVASAVIAVTIEEPVTYVVFPALIWAAYRFGPSGATLAIAIVAGLTIGITAAEVGPFFQQTIDHRTLGTQIFIDVTAITTLLLAAVVCERERSVAALAEARRREGERAVEERQRIARDLHDSVSQALFSTLLHTRLAQRALRASGMATSEPPARALSTIADLTRGAQTRDAFADLRAWQGPARRRSRPRARPARRDAVRARGRQPRAGHAGEPAGALAARRGAPVRDRSRGAGQQRQARAGDDELGSGGGLERTGRARGRRRRPRLRPGRRPSRALRAGVDAQPRRGDRCGPDDLQRPRPRHDHPRGDRPMIRVLIVDDHAVVRRGLLAFLATEPDLDVVGDAAGGADALAQIARLDAEGRRPDIVLMDLQMEPLDGIETTRRIRARHAGVDVVALTSFAEEERVRAALEAGAAGYVLKDADADEVVAAIRSVYAGAVQLDPAVARRLLASSGPPSRDAVGGLTARELDVLRQLGDGMANKEIAANLGLSERTVRTHVSSILGKLGLSSRTQAALWAAREGVVELERPAQA